MTFPFGLAPKPGAASRGVASFFHRVALALVVLAALALMPRSTALAADPSAPVDSTAQTDAKPAAEGRSGFDAERFFDAIMKVHTLAVPDAHSNATLGTEREGTGIVIDEDGLVLTIGYLIIEADEVSLVDQQGRTLPARVIGYDHIRFRDIDAEVVTIRPHTYNWAARHKSLPSEVRLLWPGDGAVKVSVWKFAASPFRRVRCCPF